MANPAVGLTWSSDLVGRSSGPGENALKYMSLMVGAGMTPVLLSPGTSRGVAARLDGLVLPGGPDIAPFRYGQEADALELEMFHAAQALRLPVLGICRGQQLLNVALGGTLHQHIVHPQWGDDPSVPVHEVTIEAGTHLRAVLGVDTAMVNSGHHQAVDVVAAPLTVSARSSDACVEGLESTELSVMSVQWHPEEMPSAATSQRLVTGFAAWLGVRAPTS
jgi:putative glutamine amidotransferase